MHVYAGKHSDAGDSNIHDVQSC